MTTRDSSLMAFEGLADSGKLRGLQLKVYQAICEIGPVHNRLLLDYLLDKQRSLPVHKQIDWRDSYFPRITELVQSRHVVDAGLYRVWHNGKQLKARHVWYVASASTEIPAAWTKVEPRKKTEKKIRPIPSLAAAVRVSSASEAGRVLQACQHKKTKTKNQQKEFVW